ATLLPLWDVVAAVEGVIGPDAMHPGETLASLRRATEDGRGTPGTPRLRNALALARESVRSPGESVMRLVLVAAGFPEPMPNLPVRDEETAKVRYIDLAWPSVGFGLEYDGDGHRTSKGQWQDDENRRDELASQGWTLARANGSELRRRRRVRRRLRGSLGERGGGVPGRRDLRGTAQRLSVERPSRRPAGMSRAGLRESSGGTGGRREPVPRGGGDGAYLERVRWRG